MAGEEYSPMEACAFTDIANHRIGGVQIASNIHSYLIASAAP